MTHHVQQTAPLLRCTTAAALFVMTGAAFPLFAQADTPVIGRWDLTVEGANGPYPSWVEVTLSGNRTLVGRFVGGGGSARPIARVVYADSAMHFAIAPQWDAAHDDLRFDATISNDRLTGTIVTPMGERQRFTGKRAPLLRRTSAPVWGEPITLFTGTDLSGWEPQGGPNRWQALNGVLTNGGSGANLVTTEQFTDFTLSLEFRYPTGGNSGVYLRGRYEVQIEDNGTLEPTPVHLGGVYGFLTANENASRGPGVWQSFDITLVGRRVTVVLNGKPVIVDQTIPGITGGALDSSEELPGPIYLQGDHTAVEYRKIVIRKAK